MHKWAKKDAHYPVTVKGAYFSGTCANDSGLAGEKTLKDVGGYAAVEVHCEFGGVSEVGVEHGCFEATSTAFFRSIPTTSSDELLDEFLLAASMSFIACRRPFSARSSSRILFCGVGRF